MRNYVGLMVWAWLAASGRSKFEKFQCLKLDLQLRTCIGRVASQLMIANEVMTKCGRVHLIYLEFFIQYTLQITSLSALHPAFPPSTPDHRPYLYRPSLETMILKLAASKSRSQTHNSTVLITLTE